MSRSIKVTATSTVPEVVSACVGTRSTREK
jgi:hypothetical protein